MLAIIHAITKWRPYLIGRRFMILTDQRSLLYFLGQRIHTPAQERWVSKLLGYDYGIVYNRDGCPNPAELAAISAPIFPFFQHLWEAYMNDPEAKKMMDDLAADPNCKQRVLMRDGLLIDKGKIIVPTDHQLRLELMHHFHDSYVWT
ncbi:uncharacterized protein [Typha latifolia]|uniref:uncharacterized protein n=1 Tax=Typha latifolia TaxID=4733 RepID=UPI003C302F27